MRHMEATPNPPRVMMVMATMLMMVIMAMMVSMMMMETERMK